MSFQPQQAHSPQTENSTVIQQGYLQAYRNGEVIKVFAVLSAKSLVLYSEDPSKFQGVSVSASIDISRSNVLEEGNFKRPKSFGIFHDQSFLEFSCATNSARLSWLKSFQGAKETTESLQKLKGIKATMDLYRAPTAAILRPSGNSSTSTATPLPPRSTTSSGISSGAMMFSDTFNQLRALSNQGGSYQQQLPVSTQSSAPALLIQPKLKKNLVAKPNVRPGNSNGQTAEAKDPPRWIPGHYRAPDKPSNNRNVSPQKVPQQTAGRDQMGFQRSASAPNNRAAPAGRRQANAQQQLFTPMPAQNNSNNTYTASSYDDYSNPSGKPLSVNALQHSNEHHGHYYTGAMPNQAVYSAHSHGGNSMHRAYSTESPFGHSGSGNQQQGGYYSHAPAQHSAPNVPTSMEHLTLAQIRAALMSIPVPIRSALMNESNRAEEPVPKSNSRSSTLQRSGNSQLHAEPTAVGERREAPRSNGRQDLTRPVPSRSQHRAPPSEVISDNGDESSSLDSGYLPSAGKKKQMKNQYSSHQRQAYAEEEMLGATTYSDSHFYLRSRRDGGEQDSEDNDEIDEDDTNGYGMANIYANYGSPDLTTRDDADLAISARSNPLLKSRSQRTESMQRSNSVKMNGVNNGKKPVVEAPKRPNPLQRSKSAPVQRPSTANTTLPNRFQPRQPIAVNTQQEQQPQQQQQQQRNKVEENLDTEKGKEMRESMLAWSKRQARDKRIGTDYFGNTKKGVQLVQGHNSGGGNRSNSNSPQRRAPPLVEFSQPLMLRKQTTPLLQGKDNVLSRSGGHGQADKKPMKVTPNAPKSFFDFKKSSKTTDIAQSNQPYLKSSSANNHGLPPQQQQILESQLLKYQQELQRKKELAQRNNATTQNQLGENKMNPMQQKLQSEYNLKRQAILSAPSSGSNQRPKPSGIPVSTFSRSTSYQASPANRPRQLSSESYESLAEAQLDEEITDKAEWHRFRSWLESIGMDHYLTIMRENGVGKLSVLELLTGDDLAQIGIPNLDASVILQKARELTDRIKSFSENADLDDWNTASNIGSSSRLATPTSFSRRKEMTVVSKAPTSPVSAVFPPTTENTFVDFKSKLIQSCKAGDLDNFFLLWDKLPAFPKSEEKLKSHDLNALLLSERPALVSAKQAMEFHLYLYFFVHSLKHSAPNKIPVLKAKSALRKYLDKIASLQEDQGSSIRSPDKLSSSPMMSSSQALQQLNLSIDPTASPPSPHHHNTSDAQQRFHDQLSSPANHTLSTTQASMEHARNLYATREFATFAGLVFVPNPQNNPAFQTLFRDEWSLALLERLEKFLDAVLPAKSIALVPTGQVATSSLAESVLLPPAASATTTMHHQQQGFVSASVTVDGVAEIIKPAPIRPTDLSVSMQSGNNSTNFAPNIAASPVPPQQMMTSITSAGSQKFAGQTSSASSFVQVTTPLVVPPPSAHSVRSSKADIAPAVETTPAHTQGNTVTPIEKSTPVEENNAEEEGILAAAGANRADACVSPASSISQLTDDTPLNRVTAALNNNSAMNPQHTMNTWLQSQTTTVAGTRPQRPKTTLGSPGNRRAVPSSIPGASANVPPTTVLMPLNQRNLLSIQQQQQLQQFQQQFGYAPVSPGGSRVSGPGTTSNNLQNGPQTPSAVLAGEVGSMAIDQVNISPMISPAAANHQPVSTAGLSTPKDAHTPDTTHGNSNGAASHPNQTILSSPTSAQQSLRMKPGVSATSSKSNLQAQVDSYNRLLKMKKLTKQSSQGSAQLQQQQSPIPSPQNASETLLSPTQEFAPAASANDAPKAENASQVQSATALDSSVQLLVPTSIESENDVSALKSVEVAEEKEVVKVEVSADSERTEAEITTVVEVAVPVTKERITVSGSTVDEEKNPSKEDVTAGNIVDKHDISKDTKDATAEVAVSPAEVTPSEPTNMSLDTSAFSIDNLYNESTNGAKMSANPLNAASTSSQIPPPSSPTAVKSVDQAMSPQQAAKYKVLLRSNQKKKNQPLARQTAAAATAPASSTVVTGDAEPAVAAEMVSNTEVAADA